MCRDELGQGHSGLKMKEIYKKKFLFNIIELYTIPRLARAPLSPQIACTSHHGFGKSNQQKQSNSSLADIVLGEKSNCCHGGNGHDVLIVKHMVACSDRFEWHACDRFINAATSIYSTYSC